MVKVLPKNDTMRKLLKHPSNGVAFPAEGPMEWPDDSFTHRRVTDGDVTIVEDKKAEKAEASVSEERPTPQPKR